MEVGWRGLAVVALLLGVLGGAIVYSLWPDGDADGGKKPAPGASAPEERKKTLAEQLEAFDQQQALAADADGGTVVLQVLVEDEAGKAVPGAEVWITANGSDSLLETLTCETCGLRLLDCTAASSMRQLLELARSGRLAPRKIASARSNQDGRVTFPEVPRGEGQLRARLGRAHAEQPLWAAEPEVDAELPEEIGDLIVLRLQPRAQRNAVVLGPDDHPVRGAQVSMIDAITGEALVAVSDDLGVVELDLASGDPQLLVEAKGFVPAVHSALGFAEGVDGSPAVLVLRLDVPHRLRVETRLSGQLVDAEVAVGGLEHPHRAIARGGIAVLEDLPAGTFDVLATYKTYVSPKQYVDVIDGDVVLRVDLKPAARLSVGVFDEKGEPVGNASLSVDGNGNSETGSTDESGALVVFEQLAEGSYQVHVQAPGLRDAQRRVDLHAGDNHLEVTLQKASMLSGKVVDEGGKPVPSATVELVSQIHEALAASTDDTGAFELPVDEPGEYSLRAREPQLGVVISQVTAPAQGLVLKLDPLGRVEVKVLGDKSPLQGAYVTVYGLGAAAEDNGTAVTDERGVARIAGLHGGAYMVSVEQSGFQRPAQQQTQLAEHGRVEITFSLEKGVEIKGRVVDEKGSPVPNAEVRTIADAPKDLDDLPSAYADENGEFLMEGLRPGRVYAVIASGDDRSTKAPVKVKAPATSVTLKLEPLPGVKGRVLDDSGQPMRTFTVDGKAFEASDGRFVIGREADAEGMLYLNVDAEGYETLTVEVKYTADLGDLKLKKAPLVRGVVLDQSGQPVSGADVTCDQCIDSSVSGGDGAFTLAIAQGTPEATVSAAKLNYRGKAKVSGAASVVVKLEPPARVEGIVKDPSGRPIAARITVREINGAAEERLDSGPDGKFALELPEGLWMFITRLAATGQTVKVTAPRVFVTLGAPPGTCAVTLTVSEAVGDAWLVPGEPDRVPLESLDDDALYEGAVALDLPLPNRPTRAAGLQCGVYTLITTDSSGVRRERVDVRASEGVYRMPPGPPQPSETAEVAGSAQPAQP